MAIVGAGGNGSIFLTHLCRIHHAWKKLGGTPFDITIYDPDFVSEANLGRQVFSECDVGHPKSQVLAARCGAFFGIDVGAVPRRFTGQKGYDVVVGCVDNLASRRLIKKRWAKSYWLDLGNGAHSGQVILGGNGLPDFFDLYPRMLRAKDPKTLPSCSMAEALERQDLFINSTIATLGAQLLWKAMRTGQVTHHGFVVNLGTGRVVPIPV